MALHLILLLSISLLSCLTVFGQTTINGYARVTSVSGTTLTISATEQSEVATTGTFVDGGNIIIMQMQDNTIGTNTNDDINFGDLSSVQSAGLYEVAAISAVSRDGSSRVISVTLSSNLLNSYNTGANSTLQIITYPTLGSPDFTTTDNLTARAWDGNIGGVLTFNVTGTLTLQHNLTVNGRGFRGGSRSNNFYDGTTTCRPSIFTSSSTNLGFKGEGIYRVTSATHTNARGKILNGGGGGNEINAGGGGGGNFSFGGVGGQGWNSTAAGCSPTSGGIGGISLSGSINANRIFMGGGGGGGQQNNSTSTNGGNGGGIILVRANQLRTTGTCGGITISANGDTSGLAGNDGAGGGGAGGSIVLQVVSWNISSTCPITIASNGGNGGSVNAGTHGGGGGGGQGAIFYSITQPTSNTTTTTNLGSGGCNNNSSPCDSQAPSGGGPNNVGIFDNASTPLPVKLIYFYAQKQNNNQINILWAIERGDVTKFELEKSVGNILNFQTIEKIVPQNQQNYQTTDNHFAKNTVYYRLKIYFREGKTDYSKVISINNENYLLDDHFIVYPNPFEKEFWVQNIENADKIIVQDVWGRKLLEIKNPVQNQNINLDNYLKGTYLILIITKDQTFTKKIMKL